ncbi:hypothetical protein FQR65_LT11650 [Abscondita terminalis]|nr:hypothetical protein FQR65_LT11650 [Abscondita terminalis]
MAIVNISILLAVTLIKPSDETIKTKKDDKKKDKASNKSKSRSSKKKKGKGVDDKSSDKTVRETPVKEVPKHVFEITKPIRSVHIEYVLIPDRPKYAIDVLCWGEIAKIFSNDGDFTIKCFVSKGIAWIPISVRHDINEFSDAEVFKLHEHIINYSFITTPSKLGKRAKTEKSKAYFIKEADIDSAERFILAYSSDPNINPTDDGTLEKDIEDFLWECADKPGALDRQEIVSRLQFLKDPLHKYTVNKIIDDCIHNKNFNCKDFAPICPSPLTEEQTEKSAKMTAFDKNSNSKNLKKDKQFDKKIKKEADKTSKTKENRKGKGSDVKISVPGEIFYTDPNLSVHKLNMESSQISQAFIITSATDILTREQKFQLNPLIIKIGKVSNLPLDILEKYRFKQIYACYNVPYIARCTTNKKHMNDCVEFNEGHAHFLHNVSKLKISEFLLTQRLYVEIRGEREEQDSVRPNLFGQEKEDAAISDLIDSTTCSRILQTSTTEPTVVTLAVACFHLSSLMKPIWDFKEIKSCHHPDSMLYEKLSKNSDTLQFVDTVTINEINLVRLKPKSWSPLTEDILTTYGTTVSIEVYLSAPLCDVLTMFTYPTLYNRLLFVVNDTKTARFFFHLIMLHNQDIFGPETVLVNYLKSGIKPTNLKMKHVTSDERDLRPAVTGFILNNATSYAFFIEGMNNSLITDIWTKIKDSQKSLMKIFYNSNFLFERRIYPEFLKFGGVYVINLQKSLFDILNQNLLYLEGSVPTPCWDALKKFDLMFNSRSFKVMHQCNLFPTAKELLSLDMEYGVPHRWT